jgi:tRNA-splicing ligase RtcB
VSDQNYNALTTERGSLIKSWTRGVPVEASAEAQLRATADLPFIHKWLAVMPDCHFGYGSTVGSVIPTKAAIVPAAVGVDLGCGMSALQTSLRASDLPDSLGAMRSVIEAAVPHGRGSFGDVPLSQRATWHAMEPAFHTLHEKHPKLEAGNASAQLGTLGGGNHFIELCLDELDNVWVMLHSGSRGIGNRIGTYFIELAKEEMRRWFINLPNEDLAYLPEGSRYFDDYVDAVHWAQDYALKNRQLMMEQVLASVRATPGLPPFSADLMAVSCHHNYVSKERHYGENVYVTRKGAVSAREGELGIIPGSMGARSFIVRGKGNRDSFHSCSHGAGRIMSRTEAKKRFTLADHAAATAGVECKKDESVLDESPGAYKDLAAVMSAQSDLVEIVRTLKQVLCVKG